MDNEDELPFDGKGCDMEQMENECSYCGRFLECLESGEKDIAELLYCDVCGCCKLECLFLN